MKGLSLSALIVTITKNRGNSSIKPHNLCRRVEYQPDEFGSARIR
jgi:hypothetical protein